MVLYHGNSAENSKQMLFCKTKQCYCVTMVTVNTVDYK